MSYSVDVGQMLWDKETVLATNAIDYHLVRKSVGKSICANILNMSDDFSEFMT